MKKIFRFSLLFVMIPVLVSQAEDERQTIYWPYFSFPPLFIVDQDTIGGYGIKIQDYLIRHLPEYEHERIDTPPKRMFEDVRQGKPYCIVGAVRTPDREAYMHYSSPCRIAFNAMVIARASDRRFVNGDKRISLESLLKNRSLVFGNVAGIQYGNDIQPIVEQHSSQESNRVEMLSSPDALARMLKMLVAQRIDYFIAEPTTIQYLAEEDPDVAHNIRFIPIKEQTKMAIAGYVACPKNEWGEMIIKKINSILGQAVSTDEYYQFALPWVRESLRNEYREVYREIMLPK